MSTGFRNGAIKLDDAAGVYYSGQVISGAVVFNLDQPLTFAVLSIIYRGEADVLWTENETVNDVEQYMNYIGHEDYFNYTENLIGGAGTSQLPAGSHVIPFKYRIPSITPSSFKGSKGQIHYKVTAIMTYLDPSAPQNELHKDFEVIAPFDLNVAESTLKQPINMEFEEVYGCVCSCGASPVTVRVQLPVTGYCPGQVIPVAVDVQNDSSVEITKMKFELVRKECYRSEQPPSEFIPPESVIATAKKGAVMANSSCEFTCDLTVPDMIAPHLDNCSIIDVRHFFRITIKVSGCNEEMQDESEIYIGLIPLKDFTDGEYIHPFAEKLPNSPIPVINRPIFNSGYIQPETTSLNQCSPPQSAPYPNYGTPYPTNNPPYPTDNKFDIELTEKKPFRDYDIGFKVPEDNPPHPDINLVPNQSMPYPKDNLMPNALPPYPADNLMRQVNAPPHTNGSFTPSAPPP